MDVIGEKKFMQIRYFFIIALISLLATKLVAASSCKSFLNRTKLENEVIYFVFVDRFYDGNNENNVPKWAFPIPQQYDSADVLPKQIPERFRYNKANRYWLQRMTDPHKGGIRRLIKTAKEDDSKKLNIQLYQGGDIQGVIDKLDYLKKLGITMLWLSPIFENVNGFHYLSGDTAYHGYWTKNWWRLEEHFMNPPQDGETLEDVWSGEKLVKELVEKAHARGIKVILDISLNHSSPAPLGTTFENDPHYFFEMGKIYGRAGRLKAEYCRPTNEKNCLQTFVDSGWFNLPMAIDDWNDKNKVESGRVYFNADINQRNSYVKQYFFGALRKWLSLGIDGLRVDAVKHIYKDFLEELEEMIIGNAAKGIEGEFPDTILIGEFFEGGIYDTWSVEWLKSTQRFTMFDFAFARKIRNYFIDGGPAEYLKIILDTDNNRNSLGSFSNELVTFINNHDLPRFLSYKKSNIDNYKAALKLMFLSRGIPKLTYGDEMGLAVNYDLKYDTMLGVGGDPWCRPVMEWNRLETGKYEDDKYIKFFNMTKRLIEFRRENPMLRFGDTQFLESVPSKTRWKDLFAWEVFQPSSYLAIERSLKLSTQQEQARGVYQTPIVYYFYSRNRQALKFNVRLKDGVYRDVVEENGKGYSVFNGILDLGILEPHEVVIISSLHKK